MIQSFLNKILTKRFMVIMDQVVFSGSSFLLTIMLAHLLGPSNFGVYSSIVLVIYFAISLITALVTQPFQVLQASNTGHDYLSFSFWLQVMLTGITVLTIGWTCSLDIEMLSSIKALGFSALMLISNFAMHDYFRKVLLAIDKVKQALVVDVITSSIQVLIVFVQLFLAETNLQEVILMLTFSYAPGFLIALFFIRPNFLNVSRWKIYITEHVHQGKWLLMTAFTQWWAGNFYIVTAGVMLGVEALGAFRLVQSLFGIFNVLLQTLENYSLPEATRLFAHSRTDAKKYLNKITSKAGLMFGIILLILCIFPKAFLLLIGGSQYTEYGYVVQGMSVLYALIFLGYPIRMAIRMLVLTRSIFVGYLLSFGFSMLLAKFMLEQWSLLGAVIGLILSQVILLVYWQFILIKHQFVLWK